MPQMYSAPVNTGARMKVTPPRPFEQPNHEHVRKQKEVDDGLSELGKFLKKAFVSLFAGKKSE